MLKLKVIDSHTGGEPTRVILEGQIDLKGSTMAARRDDFRKRFDHIRRGLVTEPRGIVAQVGALLTPPISPGSTLGVIFFNEADCLGMCGHGTIGLLETMRYLGRETHGTVTIDTPVGTVQATFQPDGWISIRNVVSHASKLDVTLEVPSVGKVVGDIAYGGNWFFIVRSPRFKINLARVRQLDQASWAVYRTLAANGITGDKGAEIDHIELFSATAPEGADSMNYVLCPDGTYDRSPCGTGTSAKMATLFARGELKEREVYRQASITGSVFKGSVEVAKGGVIPTITGQAFVTAEATMVFADDDPLAWGNV